MIPSPLVDLALAPAAGYLGNKAMEPVGSWLHERESQADRDREGAVHPGPPYGVEGRGTTPAATCRVPSDDLAAPPVRSLPDPPSGGG